MMKESVKCAPRPTGKPGPLGQGAVVANSKGADSGHGRQAVVRGSLVFAACVVAAVPALWAAEPDGQAVQHKMTSVPSSDQRPAAPVPPAATPPESPITTTNGSIAALDLQASMPTLRLTATDGKAWALTLDPKRTMVWDGSRETRLDQFIQGTAATRLRVGQRVKVSHRLKNGQELAETIRVLQTATPSPSASTPKTTY